MVYMCVLFSTKQGTTLHLAFSFNTVHTQTQMQTALRNQVRMWNKFFLILSQLFLTIARIPSKAPLVASAQVQEVMQMRPSLPLHTGKNSPPALYNKDKALSFNSKVTGTAAYRRKTAEEIKGILRDFVRCRKV